MYHKTLGHPNQNYYHSGDKIVRNHLVKKTRLQNSIMFYDLLDFFFKFIGPLCMKQSLT